jgi:HSP20 family protein
MLPRSATVPDLDRLTARVFDSATRRSGARLDAHRDGDTCYIDIDLPGGDPASIDVAVDHKVVTVRAARKQVEGDDAHSAGAESQVVLSDSLDMDRLEARHDNGVLTLSIPVIERAGSRKSKVIFNARTPGDQELAEAA